MGKVNCCLRFWCGSTRRLPLTRELSAKLTEGEIKRAFSLSSEVIFAFSLPQSRRVFICMIATGNHYDFNSLRSAARRDSPLVRGGLGCVAKQQFIVLTAGEKIYCYRIVIAISCNS